MKNNIFKNRLSSSNFGSSVIRKVISSKLNKFLFKLGFIKIGSSLFTTNINNNIINSNVNFISNICKRYNNFKFKIKRPFGLHYVNTLSIFSKDKIFNVLLITFSYLCLLIVIIKCYFDINYLLVVIKYALYGKFLTWVFKNFILNKLNNFYFKKLLFLLLIFLLIYINIVLFSSIVFLLSGLSVNFNQLLLLGVGDLNYDLSSDNGNGNNNTYNSSNNSNTNTNNSNSSSTSNNSDNNTFTSYLRDLFAGLNVRVEVPASVIVNLGVGMGGAAGAGRLASSVMQHTQGLPIGTRIITSLGVFTIGTGGALFAATRISNQNNSQPLVINGVITPNSGNSSGNNGSTSTNASTSTSTSTSTSSNQTGNNQTSVNNNNSMDNSNVTSGNINNSSDIIIDDNLSLDLNLNSIFDSVKDGSITIYSINEKMSISNLEDIIYTVLNLEYVNLSLSLITFNIFFVRFLLKNYKDYIKILYRVLTFNKLNIDRLVYNILEYNLKFYNIIAMICISMIILFKIFNIYFIFHLYINSLYNVVQYMLFYKYKNISVNEGTNEVVVNSISFIKNSYLENILLYLGVYNLIIILLILLNMILYLKYKKLNNYILIISLLLYLVGIFINFYYLFDLIQNIKTYISEYIDLHITLNSSILFLIIKKDKKNY